VMPEDLVKYGRIPEFIGRLPVVTSVSKLTREALVQVITEPRNALARQYERLFDLDGVELQFTDDAYDAIADLALRRGTGARGLRSIMEDVLMSAMYEVPSRADVSRVVVNADAVNGDVAPTMVPRKVAAAKAKATREERKAARPVPTWYGQTPYEQATAANGRRVRQVLGEAGWQAFLAAKDVAAYGGHQYDNNTILRHAVGTRAALDVLEAAGLHETANF